jgi:predicted TPR repeat methyltransferase
MDAKQPLLVPAYAALKAREWAEADAICRKVLRTQPTCAEAMAVLASVHRDRGDDIEAMSLLESALYCEPDFLRAYARLGSLYQGQERFEKAAEVYRRWTLRDPSNVEAQHMLSATTGVDVPSRCSEAYVSTHFNHFATEFDQVLVKGLNYRGPRVVATLLSRYRTGEGATLDVLDAGCGTGLCGPEIREHCHRLTGIDLSEQMIDRARLKQCYDELVVADLNIFMSSWSERFDAVVSSDVFVYLGALEPTMAAAYATLKPDGVLVFTVEALLTDGTEPYRLTPSGRYAHRENYLLAVLTEPGFSVLSMGLDSLRMENHEKAASYCVVAQKPAVAAAASA